jgi:hypothetical protein
MRTSCSHVGGGAYALLFVYLCILWYIAALSRAREWALLQPWQALRYNRPYISRPCIFGFYISHFTRLSLRCKTLSTHFNTVLLPLFQPLEHNKNVLKMNYFM